MHGDFVRFVRVLIVAQVSNQRQEVGFTLTLIAFSVSDRAGASNSRCGASAPPVSCATMIQCTVGTSAPPHTRKSLAPVHHPEEVIL